MRSKSMKKILKSSRHPIALALLMLVHFACQLPTQPTNITTNSPTTVIVQDQGNNPVKEAGVSVQWRVLRVADSVWHTMSPTNAQINDGTFVDVIPIPVGDDTSHVAFQINAPAGYTPATQIDTEIGYCGSEVFTFHVAQVPITITTCDPTARTSSVNLIANEPLRPMDTAQTATFINSLGTLSFSYAPLLPSPPTLPNIVLECSTDVGKTWSALPGQINSGASYLFRFRFTTNSAVTQPSSSQYIVTISGLDAAGDTCVKLVETVNTQVKVQTPCDCPTGTFTYFDTASTCGSVAISDTISLKNIANTNTQCALVFARAASSKLDNDVSISPDLSGMVIQPNQNVPGKLILSFNPQTVKTYDVEYDYTISRRAPDGTITPCDSDLRIYFHGTVGVPSCAIDPTSRILVNDTLKQVINSDSSSGKKAICVKNTGGCPVSITTENLVSNRSHPFRILTALPVVIPPGADGCIEVSFNPTDNDVWPPNGLRSAGAKPVDTFYDSLQITTSANCKMTVPVVGVLTLPNYNNPCLQQWGTNKFYGGIVLDDSGTFTQSTEPASPQGFSIYASFVDPAGTSATLMSGGTAGGTGSYVTFAKIDQTLNFASNDICELSAINNYSGKCGTIPTMTGSIGNLIKGDVILFEYFDPKSGKQECGLIWITDITSTSGNGISVCFQMCFPI